MYGFRTSVLSLEREFQPLAFDVYGASVPDVIGTLDTYASVLVTKAQLPLHLDLLSSDPPQRRQYYAVTLPDPLPRGPK